MLKLCKFTKVKVLFPVLVSVFHSVQFLLIQIGCRHFEEGSIECRKTKPKIITLANHKERQQHNRPIRAGSKYRRQARENACDHVTISFGLASHWLRKCREFSKSITEQNQGKSEITLYRQLKNPYFSGCINQSMFIS